MDMEPVRAERDALRAQAADAAAVERAAVVAWLRWMIDRFHAKAAASGALAIDRLTVDVGDLADAIERGDHNEDR